MPSARDLPNPGIKPGSPAFQADSLPFEPPGKPTVLRDGFNIEAPKQPKRWKE